jgi:hypothetical protein
VHPAHQHPHALVPKLQASCTAHIKPVVRLAAFTYLITHQGDLSGLGSRHNTATAQGIAQHWRSFFGEQKIIYLRPGIGIDLADVRQFFTINVAGDDSTDCTYDEGSSFAQENATLPETSLDEMSREWYLKNP